MKDIQRLRELLNRFDGPWDIEDINSLADYSIEHLPAILDRYERMEAALALFEQVTKALREEEQEETTKE